MGTGPAPDERVVSRAHEHGHGEWRVDYDTWVGMLSEMYRSQPLLQCEMTMPALATFYGMPIRVDDNLPPGVIELHNVMGETLGRIENVGTRPPPMAQQEPRRIRMPVYIDGEQVGTTEAEYAPPTTGPTTRLPTACRACGDTLPLGATFCIECGEKV